MQYILLDDQISVIERKNVGPNCIEKARDTFLRTGEHCEMRLKRQ